MKEGLEAEAARKYPMPVKPCVLVRARIEWLREQYINNKKLKR